MYKTELWNENKNLGRIPRELESRFFAVNLQEHNKNNTQILSVLRYWICQNDWIEDKRGMKKSFCFYCKE